MTRKNGLYSVRVGHIYFCVLPINCIRFYQEHSLPILSPFFYHFQALKLLQQHSRPEATKPVVELPPSPTFLPPRHPSIPPHHPLANTNLPLARWALPFLTLRGGQQFPQHQRPPVPLHPSIIPHHPHHHDHTQSTMQLPHLIPHQSLLPHPAIPHPAMVHPRFVLPIRDRDELALPPGKRNDIKPTFIRNDIKSRILQYCIPAAVPSKMITS